MNTNKISKKSSPNKVRMIFERVSSRVTKLTGSPGAFITALSVIALWLVTGPVFHYSDTWQLFINTGTTIVTFLMVFIIQQSQNKETTALQMKINELIACNDSASNRLINSESITEEELEVLKKFYVKLSEMASKNRDLYSSHSLDEAEKLHTFKAGLKKKKQDIK